VLQEGINRVSQSRYLDTKINQNLLHNQSKYLSCELLIFIIGIRDDSP
jgi:hypothetical protein